MGGATIAALVISVATTLFCLWVMRGMLSTIDEQRKTIERLTTALNESTSLLRQALGLFGPSAYSDRGHKEGK